MPRQGRKLLEAVWLPKEVTVLHCKGHQNADNITAQGNRLADRAAKKAANKEVLDMMIGDGLEVMVTAVFILLECRLGMS